MPAAGKIELARGQPLDILPLPRAAGSVSGRQSLAAPVARPSTLTRRVQSKSQPQTDGHMLNSSYADFRLRSRLCAPFLRFTRESSWLGSTLRGTFARSRFGFHLAIAGSIFSLPIVRIAEQFHYR